MRSEDGISSLVRLVSRYTSAFYIIIIIIVVIINQNLYAFAYRVKIRKEQKPNRKKKRPYRNKYAGIYILHIFVIFGSVN